MSDQPRDVPRVRVRNQRDQGVEADRVTMAVDFEGTGHTAYGLTLTITNSIRDAVLSHPTMVEGFNALFAAR